ncbi:hypothetical protein UCD39_00845 [Nitrospirillum sp. BR 11752]|uniref:hypothetical protein n=1 Tax=Nitrospirillum sp. BR 11752 TaxID=3104293 RepID=UPI002E9D871F|nr:hypothetical protein [Nitrospirillum sp. BR 11752]
MSMNAPFYKALIVPAALVGALTLAMCCTVAQAADAQDGAQDAARRVCRDTMGLAPTNVDFVACVDSLKKQATAAQQTLPKSRACAEMGHTPGSVDHRQCVAKLAAALHHAQSPAN